jgi:hypothetical protein
VSAALSPTVTRDDGAIAERRIVRIDWRKFHGVRRCHRLDHGELADPVPARWITEHPDPRHVRRNLLEQFQPFSGEAVFKLSKASDVAAGPSHAADTEVGDRCTAGFQSR